MRIERMIHIKISIVLLLAVICSAQDKGGADRNSEIRSLWIRMQRVELNSSTYESSRTRLTSILNGMTGKERSRAAAVLMRRNAPDGINESVVEMIGIDKLSLPEIGEMVNDSERTWSQRLLIKVCYKFISPEFETTMDEPTRQILVGFLASRINALASMREVPYGEQRLIYHMLEPVLMRYAGKASTVTAAGNLYNAIKKYIQIDRKNDGIGHTMSAWTTIDSRQDPADVRTAVRILGHWDPLMRQKAATWLGNKISEDENLVETVFKKLHDPRDEVRAAAARVFSYAAGYKSSRVITSMVRLLIDDPGVTVQKAASEALITHADTSETEAVTSLLIKQIEDHKPSPGPKRMSSIMSVLSYYINPGMRQSTKTTLVEIGVKYLAFSPSGALTLLEGLGPAARQAIPNIKEFRDTKADRLTKRRINRNVLWAIDPNSVKQ